jgi:DNA-binding NarL/FixJ family response regulator
LKGAQSVTTRVVIADDLDDLRWLLRNQLELDGDCRVVGEAGNGVQAVEAVTATHPDVVVLDLMMPKMSGLDAAAEVAQVSPLTRIVLYSAVSEVAVAAAGHLEGVEYVRKGATPRDIVDAVARVTSKPEPEA